MTEMLQSESALGALKDELRALAGQNGVDLFGVADLTPAADFMVRQGGTFLARFPRAISIGLPVTRGMVEPLQDHANGLVATHYHYYIYEIVNRQLNAVALMLANRLEAAGHAALVVPASVVADKEKLVGMFSQKLAAHLAGLGFIGKNCLLVTPQYGGRVRLATILTDADLSDDAPGEGSCGECRACVDACPPRAFTGVEFRPEDPREVRFRAELCDRYMGYREKTVGKRVCGLCVLACAPRPAGEE
ncbi:MAG: 4Fe-4S binding protein [Chloroflexota bacterium]